MADSPPEPYGCPPRLAERILSRLLPKRDRGSILGDLAEEHARRARTDGVKAAGHWYWRQLPRSALPALRRRLENGTGRTGEARMGSGRSWLSWLDVKLAVRMLMKQPGLTLVAIFALAIGIPIGLLPLHVLDSLAGPLPVEDWEEIVMVRHDLDEASWVMRPSDFVQWREELSAFEDLGMWRTGPHNVLSDDGWAAPVRGSETTASFFSALRVPPLFGRPLNEADEVIGAPDVVVIGYGLWQSRLAGDPDVVGRTIRVGAVPHTVVGVMPEAFQFPFRSHLWLPFRDDPLAYEQGREPTGWIMGRLADGVSIEEARNEIEVVGQRRANQFPDTHARHHPQVLSYNRAVTQIDDPEARVAISFIQILALSLLALACGNVGILTLARAATRSRELAIRTALGASRVRIVSQLFVESLVLAVLAAGVGLVILQALANGADYLSDAFPFWVDFDISLGTAVPAMSLAAFSAVIAGVVPALKATGKGVQTSIQHASGGGSGIRFGAGYSILIVSEVGVALWFLALGASLLPSAVSKPGGLGIQTDQYLSAALRFPQVDQTASVEESDRPVFVRRVGVAHEELVRRLSAEPGLGPVAIASALPGMSHDIRWMQVEGMPPAPGSPAPAHAINVARVDLGYFDALDQPILSGRKFSAADFGEDRSAVIVNTSFVERVLGGRNPLGRRVRYWAPNREAGPWSFEIVGVVGPLGMNSLKPEADQGLYHVVAPGELHPVSFAVRVGSDPESATPRLRSIVTEIDASASLENPVALDEASDLERRLFMWSTYLVALLAGVAIVLSSACLYALVSFTVAERTRECGIRIALGAQSTNIMSAIEKRAFLQLFLGVAIAAVLSALLLSEVTRYNTFLRTSHWPLTVGLSALSVIVVGTLACVKPTLRAIRIRPMEVLKG